MVALFHPTSVEWLRYICLVQLLALYGWYFHVLVLLCSRRWNRSAFSVVISIRRKIIWIRYEAQFFEMKIVYLTWVICCVVRDETSNSCQCQYNQQKKDSLNECDEASAQPTESEINTKQCISFYILGIIFFACMLFRHKLICKFVSISLRIFATFRSRSSWKQCNFIDKLCFQLTLIKIIFF